ncbi:LOW QUALITY PROTEIN: hypothetical protein V2J09_014465 [Rumex salicifolius]
MDFRSLPCTFIGYSTSHKGYLCYHPPTLRIYISRYVVFNEEVYPFVTMRSQPSQSVSTSPVESVSSSILSHASVVPDLPAVNYNPPSPSPIFTPPEPLPTTPPSHQRPTISSQAKQVVPSHYRPAANNQHSMVTRASTNSLKPKSPISTPADSSSHLLKCGDLFSDSKLYRQVVGSLQYATITRPNITYAVNRVCQYMHSPTNLHWQAVKRILRYLNGTLDHCLHFQPTTALSLLAYSDAGWISDKDDSRSQYGFAVFHGRNLTSRKQRVVARSSTEAEYRALAYTSAELLWINQLLRDLRVSLPQPPVLLCDNIGATFMCKNPVINSKSKHINLDLHFVREQVETGALKVSHVSSSDQLANIFTKALGKDRIAVLRSKLQVKPALQLAGAHLLQCASTHNHLLHDAENFPEFWQPKELHDTSEQSIYRCALVKDKLPLHHY